MKDYLYVEVNYQEGNDNNTLPFWAVVTWLTDDCHEEGCTVAEIGLDGSVVWLDKEAMDNDMVKDEIALFLKDAYVSARDDYEQFVEMFQYSIKHSSYGSYTIHSKDGETRYSFEKKSILSKPVIGFGFDYTDSIIVIDIENLSTQDIIDRIYEDIVSGVGEEFIIVNE